MTVTVTPEKTYIRKIHDAIEEQMEAGIAILDEKLPGWEEEIDVGRLKLMDCKRCVLGQLCGGYGTGLSLLGLGLSSTLGFRLPWFFEADLNDEERMLWTENHHSDYKRLFEHLTKRWIEVIEERRS